MPLSLGGVEETLEDRPKDFVVSREYDCEVSIGSVRALIVSS